MKPLHNRVNGKELKQALEESAEIRKTLSFYKYFKIEEPQAFRDSLYSSWQELGVFGRVYVAEEGINAQISVPETGYNMFEKWMSQHQELHDIDLNMAIEAAGKSFFKLKIQVKSKIVADGLNDKSFDVTNCGKHLLASEFNEMADQPDTIIVDMRNHYESEVGHFENAILPDTDTFRETLSVVEDQLKGKENQNIVMYCTGGIRCEKASAYYKHVGFKNVFQLKGGIIQYTRDVDAQGLSNKFKGKNFVFDERLGERITEEVISRCHQCGKPSDDHTNCLNYSCHLLFIQCEECAKQYEGCCSEECQEVVKLPLDEQKRLRKGIDRGQMIYKKGRSENLTYKK